MASLLITKNNLQHEISNLSERISLLSKGAVYDNYINYANQTYNDQLCSCNKINKFNINVNEHGIAHLTKDDDCIFQSHYHTLEDKVLTMLGTEVLNQSKRNIKSFKKYILTKYNVELNNKNVESYLSELKGYDKHLYYSLFEKCSEKLRKEHLSNAEIAYIEYIEELKFELQLLEKEKEKYFN